MLSRESGSVKEVENSGNELYRTINGLTEWSHLVRGAFCLSLPNELKSYVLVNTKGSL